MLTEEQLRQRDGKLTSSRVACLMTGDEAEIMRLWHQLIGDPEYQDEENLEHIWAVRLGEATEKLQLDWYQERTGRPVTRRGEVAVHPKLDWAAATLDGWDEMPIECKCVGGWEKHHTIIQRYQPQYHWLMLVTESTQLKTSIIEGARAPVIELIHWDEVYGAELFRRALIFMDCVHSLSPPVIETPVAPPVQVVREEDMSTSNAWVSSAHDWLQYRDSAKAFGVAADTLKKLVPADVARAFGGGVEAVRNRAGAITIKTEDRKVEISNDH